jgi:hypothetical protein
MASKKYLVQRGSGKLGLSKTPNKYETLYKGISSRINAAASSENRSFLPGDIIFTPIDTGSITSTTTTTTTTLAPTTTTSTTTTTTTSISSLTLSFTSIAAANALVGNASDVADWNSFFFDGEFPNATGNPFTSVQISGNNVILTGGNTIELSTAFESSTVLTAVNDTGCIDTLIFNAFGNCPNLTNVTFLGTTYVDTQTFYNCPALTTINLSACADLGVSVGNNSVFEGTTGNTITLTIPSALMTCNSGLPDGDIQYLQANNTVTIVQV